MEKQNKYTFGEITWVVGNDELNKLVIIPAIVEIVNSDTIFVSDLYGKTIKCDDIREGINELLSYYYLTISPKVLDNVSENSTINGLDVFKLCMYNIKGKAVVYTNNFHYQDIVFNKENFYFAKVMNRQYSSRKLLSIGIKATNAINTKLNIETLKEEKEHTINL